MTSLLLDSMAALRLVNGDPMESTFLKAMQKERADRRSMLVSPASAWDLATLASLGRIRLLPSPEAWIRDLLALPGIALAPMPVETLVAARALPGRPPADSAAQIIAATARREGCRVVTRSASLIRYGQDGQIDVVKC